MTPPGIQEPVPPGPDPLSRGPADDLVLEVTALLGASRAEEVEELLAELPAGPERDRLALLAGYALGQEVDAVTAAEPGGEPALLWTTAWILAATGRSGAARRLLASALAEGAALPGLAVLAARLDLEHGDLRGARARLRAGLDAPEAASRSRLERAAAALAVPDAATAAAVLEDELDRDPKDPDGWLGLGEARWADGDRTGAVAAWTRGLKQRPEDRDLRQRVSRRALRDRRGGWLVGDPLGRAAFSLWVAVAVVAVVGLLPVSLPAEAWVAVVLFGGMAGVLTMERLQDQAATWLASLPRHVRDAVTAAPFDGMVTVTTRPRQLSVVAAVIVFGPVLVEVPIRLVQGAEVPGWRLVWFASGLGVAALVVALIVTNRRRTRRVREHRLLQRLLDAA
jgi:hypothetical protein